MDKFRTYLKSSRQRLKTGEGLISKRNPTRAKTLSPKRQGQIPTRKFLKKKNSKEQTVAKSFVSIMVPAHKAPTNVQPSKL